MMMPAIPDYLIREYRPGDETAIVELFSAVFGASMTIAQWRWKYAADRDSGPWAQLAFNTAGRLVGHAGAVPLRGWRQGQPTPFFQIGDVMVHPDARGQLGGRNLFTRLARALLTALAEQGPQVFAYGFPGRRPFLLGQYARVYGEIEPALALRRPARRWAWPWLPLRPLAWDDARLDRLWQRRAPDHPLTLIRDRDYLHWRYAGNPFHVYRLLGLSLAGRLIGWVVTRREEARLLVIDALLPRRWLRPALAALDRIAVLEGASESIIWLPPDWRAVAGSAAQPTGVIVANMVWALPIATAEARANLYYTMGDLDIF